MGGGDDSLLYSTQLVGLSLVGHSASHTYTIDTFHSFSFDFSDSSVSFPYTQNQQSRDGHGNHSALKLESTPRPNTSPQFQGQDTRLAR